MHRVLFLLVLNFRWLATGRCKPGRLIENCRNEPVHLLTEKFSEHWENLLTEGYKLAGSYKLNIHKTIYGQSVSLNSSEDLPELLFRFPFQVKGTKYSRMNIKIFVFLFVALVSMLCSVSAQYRWGELIYLLILLVVRTHGQSTKITLVARTFSNPLFLPIRL